MGTVYHAVRLRLYTCSVLCFAADSWTMKTVVALLLLCLCDPGWSDCQADCVSCSNILPKQLSFNTMVRSADKQHSAHTFYTHYTYKNKKRQKGNALKADMQM